MKKTVLMKIDFMSIFLLLLLFLSGCQSERNNNYDLVSMPSVPLEGEVMEECLLTPYCSQMKFIQSKLFFFAPVHEDVALVTTEHVDTIGYVSRVGSGPGEMNQWPYFSGASVTGDTLYMYDQMTHSMHTYVVQVTDDNVSWSFVGKEPTKENGDELPDGYLKQTVCQLDRLENGYSIGYRILTTGNIFTLFDPNLTEVAKFGEYPLKEGFEEGQIHQTVLFQGCRETSGNSLYYAPHEFGYMARYDVSDEGEVTKAWERWYTQPSYEVKNNKLDFKMDNLEGFFGLAVGKKYIFATFSGIPLERMYKERSAYARRSTYLYVFDLNGNPLAKFDTGKRVTNMCLDEKEDYLYVKHYDPDISLWRYKVSDMVKHVN